MIDGRAPTTTYECWCTRPCDTAAEMRAHLRKTDHGRLGARNHRYCVVRVHFMIAPPRAKRKRRLAAGLVISAPPNKA